MNMESCSLLLLAIFRMENLMENAPIFQFTAKLLHIRLCLTLNFYSSTEVSIV